MKKLYIPTSTLNFNNILATESISPESFYVNRNFGYKRFTKVEPNPFSNSLIAYDKLPIFKIKESDYDDYPMIIEISEQLIKKDSIVNSTNKNGINIFQINKTIYLNPGKVKFIFFNKSDLKITLIKAEPSIETKLIPVYQKRFEIANKKDYPVFQWNKKYLISTDIINKNIQENIHYDLLINKLKGFYYSYYLGSIHSFTNKEKNYKKNIQNIAMSLAKISNNENVISKKNIAIINIAIEQLNKIEVSLKKEASISELTSVSQIAEINFNRLKITQLTDSLFDNNENEIYRSIINEIIEYPIYDTQIFQFEKINLTFKIGAVLKDYFTNWDKSKERKYLNDLMDNIESYKPFDLKSHPSILLQSIALFILKGDDPEKLLENLSKNEINDYRIAMGLWGAIFGFSALPKTLTNILFKKEIKNLTRLLYKDVQYKLHNVNSEEKILIENNKISNKSIIGNNAKTAQKNKQILAIIKDCCKLKQSQIDAILQIYEHNNQLINKHFFIEIKKIRGIGIKTIEKIKNSLDYNKKGITHPLPSLFQDYKISDTKFYEDKFVFDYLVTIIPKQYSKKFKEDLLWFQNEFQKGSNSKYYGKAKKDNKSVIESFKRYLEKRIYFNKININLIIKKLEERYA